MKARFPYIVFIVPCAGVLALAADAFYSITLARTGASSEFGDSGLGPVLETVRLSGRFFRVSSLDSSAHWLLKTELWFLCCFSLFLLLKSFRVFRAALTTRQRFNWVFPRLFLCFVIAALAYAQTFSGGRSILAVGLSMPGSMFTRFLNVDLDPWLRRLVEPSFWILLLAILLAAKSSLSRPTRRLYNSSFAIFFVLLLCESALLVPVVRNFFSGSDALRRHTAYVHFLLTEGGIALLLFGISREIKTFRAEWKSDEPSIKGNRRLLPIAFGTAALFVVLVMLTAEHTARQREPLVGAHYYSWFPGNWRHGYVGRELIPPVLPLLGEYGSGRRDIIAQHVAWAKDAGINFFVFDWWPERIDIRRHVRDAVWKDSSLFDGFQFAIQFETLGMKVAEKERIPGEDLNAMIMNENRASRLKSHWAFIAKHYMNHPGYLHIDGRPVLFVYATRHVVGSFAKVIREARDYVKAKTGKDIYLVGDEVFFNVLTLSEKGKIVLRPELVPEWERLIAFDGITCYNPYDSMRKEHGGEKGAELFLRDVSVLYQQYKKYASTNGQLFIPGVLPGFNDRGVRLAANHFVVPRIFQRDPVKSFFRESLLRWALPFIDSLDPVFTITSWNEWNEGTQIEPSTAGSLTNEDRMEGLVSGFEFHEGYSCKHLQELSEVLGASNGSR